MKKVRTFLLASHLFVTFFRIRKNVLTITLRHSL